MISIIVPVYKAETFITRCIESIISQTYPNWELILVDDGSPDNSGHICEEFAQRDSRIHVFYKPNGGVSSARNLGIESAKGEWITFIDSDDYILPNYLENLSEGADDDLIISGSQRFGDSEDDYHLPESRKYEIHEFIKMVFEAKSEENLYTSCISYPWGKLLRTDIIRCNHLTFDTNMKLSEDTCFMLQYLELIREVSFKKGGEYMYNVSSVPKPHLMMNYDEYIIHVETMTQTVSHLGSAFNVGINKYLTNMYSMYFNAFIRNLKTLNYSNICQQYRLFDNNNHISVDILIKEWSHPRRLIMKFAMLNRLFFFVIVRYLL